VTANSGIEIDGGVCGLASDFAEKVKKYWLKKVHFWGRTGLIRAEYPFTNPTSDRSRVRLLWAGRTGRSVVFKQDSRAQSSNAKFPCGRRAGSP
jgi:hypothetical protein